MFVSCKRENLPCLSGWREGGGGEGETKMFLILTISRIREKASLYRGQLLVFGFLRNEYHRKKTREEEQ